MNCLKDCKAKCCKNIILDGLSQSQLDMFKAQAEKSKNIRMSWDNAEFVPSNQNLFDVDFNECPFLRGNKCNIWTNPNRPSVCGYVQAGDANCLSICTR